MWLRTLMIVVAGILLWAAVLTSGAVAQPAGSSGKTPLAEIDGETLTAEEVEAPVALQIFRLESQLHALRRKALEEAIAQRLLEREAKRQGLSVEALVGREVEAKAAPPTDEEVGALLKKRKGEGTVPSEAEAGLKEQLRNYLIQQKQTQQRERYLADLRANAKVVTHLPGGRTLRVPVQTDGEPVAGPPDARVTIVEFSDFQCPFCQRVQPTLKSLLKAYPDSVRLVYRDFPIPQLHKEAKKAAEAARCAAEQGKFWEYHDLLFANPAKQKEADLKRYAADLKLDKDRFAQCLATVRYAKVVERGMADGKNIGVTGTPAFFVNGIPLVGAQPLEQFKALIDQELSRLEQSASATKKSAQ